MACYKSDRTCSFPGRPCSMCEYSDPNYKQSEDGGVAVKKYLVVYSYKSHSYDYIDGEDVDGSGIKNKIVETDKDVFYC